MKRSTVRHALAAVYNSPWAILPEKLSEIREVIDLRHRGVRLTAEQVRTRLADVRGPQQVQAPNKVAVLNLFGTISHRMNFFSEFSGGTSTELFAQAFDAAVADPEVSAIVIVADSPGGTVPGVMELSDKIYAARGKKRIVTVVDPTMASAALWIGTAASTIVATPSAQHIGSIGVLYVHQDDTVALEKAGITQTLIASNEFKAELHGPLTDTAKARIQDRIGKIHEQFVAAIARNRGVTVAKVESDFGRGRTLTATEALSVGLIDRIATLETVLSELGATGLSAGPSGANPRAEQKPGKESVMHKKILTSLIRAGIVEADCTEQQYTAGIDKFFVDRGKAKPDGNEEFLAGVMSMLPVSVSPTQTVPANPATQPATGQSTGTSGGERVSIETIVASVRLATNIPAEARLALQDELVKAQTTLSHSALLDRINAEAVKHTPQAGGTKISAGEASIDKFQIAARDALLTRTWGASVPKQIFDYRTQSYVDFKSTSGRDYSLQSLPRLGQRLMIACGMPMEQVLGLSTTDMAMMLMGADGRQFGVITAGDGAAYNVSGMFQNLLLDASNVILRRSYDDARTTFQLWMRNAPSLPDFKLVNKVIAGELGDPRAIPENGEFEETTLSDGKISYRLTVWGEVVSHTWQMVVNDQLGAFTEFDQKLGRAMKRKQNRLGYGVLKDNATMPDTGALFNSTALTSAGGHNNLATGSIAANAYGAAFSGMDKRMREMKGLDTTNSAILNISPRFCLFPPAIRDSILQQLGSMADPSSSNSGVTNVYRGAYEPIEEGELGAGAGGSDTALYLVADANDIDTVEYAYLQGLEAPRIEMATSFDRLAVRKRIYHAFAVAAIDFRGMQRHNGA